MGGNEAVKELPIILNPSHKICLTLNTDKKSNENEVMRVKAVYFAPPLFFFEYSKYFL